MLVYQGKKIIPPHDSRKELLLAVHGTHKSKEMTLRTARANFQWPGLSNQVNQLVNNCSICKDFKRVQRKKMGNEGKVDITKLKPLDSVAIDLGYLGINRPFLALVDEYSGLKQVWPIPDSKTRSVISVLEQFFSSMGFPIIIRSDGGPCFKSHAFQEWCKSRGVRHVKSSPGYHESSHEDN